MDHSKPAPKSKCHVLVTGGNGFIGSHIARRYFAMGHPVTVADIASRSHFRNVSPGIKTFEGDLRDPDFCARVVRTADVVVHLAANMGGMGTIHEENEAKIYQDNHTITLNILSACVDAGVEKFFYASSACVYPTSLQDGAESDVSLCEHDVWANPPPRPQGLYGLEKLNTELVIQNYATGNMKTYISRFHNIYGPYGSWKDGREKVPAALLRKAIVAKLTGKYEVEVWGDGSQRRSFCYIDDAVEGVLKLLDSDCHAPVNIGSEEAICIDDLARKAAEAVGLDLSRLELQHVVGRPVGVASRNSNNSFVEAELGWKPRIGLQEGLKRTAQWIRDEIDRCRRLRRVRPREPAFSRTLGRVLWYACVPESTHSRCCSQSPPGATLPRTVGPHNILPIWDITCVIPAERQTLTSNSARLRTCACTAQCSRLWRQPCHHRSLNCQV